MVIFLENAFLRRKFMVFKKNRLFLIGKISQCDVERIWKVKISRKVHFNKLEDKEYPGGSKVFCYLCNYNN